MRRACFLLMLMAISGGVVRAQTGATASLDDSSIWSDGETYNDYSDYGSGYGEPAQEHGWVSAEMLLWWFDGNDTPPLVTTGPLASMGIIGRPGTSVLYGDEGVGDRARLGFRLTGGLWLTESLGAEVYTMWVGNDNSTDFSATSVAGVPLISRPYFDALTNNEDAFLVGFPNLVDGTTSVTSKSKLYSSGLLFRSVLTEDAASRIDFVGGYRYANVQDSLVLREDLTWQGGGLFANGSSIRIQDGFQAVNNFHGGDLGLNAIMRQGRVTFDVMGRLAIGSVFRRAEIGGSTSVAVPNGPMATAEGGLLALASNSGVFKHDRTSLLPQLDVNLRFQATEHISLGLGYSLFYMTNVWRSGTMIDRSVNTNQVQFLGGGVPPFPGPVAPRTLLKDTTFWAQGINFCAEVRF